MASTGSATCSSPPFALAPSASRTSNEQPDALASDGATVDDVRRRLHATDEARRLIVGADVAIWWLTPGEGELATLLGNPVMLPATRLAYDWFTDMLFAWNKRRGAGECRRLPTFTE
jgi:predicted DCC family thiol-disulfide oxidoreductase YuxK